MPGTNTMDADTGTGVDDVRISDTHLTVVLEDGRSISAPLEWYPRLTDADRDQLQNWTVSAGGFGIHWPDLDEDLSTEGLLRGTPAPGARV